MSQNQLSFHMFYVRCEGSCWNSEAGGDSTGAAADPGEEAGSGTAAWVSPPTKRVSAAQVPAHILMRCSDLLLYFWIRDFLLFSIWTFGEFV